jgi:two-component system, OmpR family, sensor histidine kinase TctE
MPCVDWATDSMPGNPKRRPSIRRRLLGLLAIPVAVVLAIGTISDFLTSIGPIREAYDRALSDAALALALNVQVDAQGQLDAHVSREALNILRTDSADQIFFSVSLPDGTLLAGDADLPRAGNSRHNPDYSTAIFRGEPIRLVTFRGATRAGPVLVTVAETRQKRGSIRTHLWSAALWADLLELIALLACVWFGVRLALRPLERLGDQIAARSPTDLTPLSNAGVPLELRTTVNRLNALLATLEESGRAERQFVESAAHQLRTPLAGLLAQLDLLVADEANPERRGQLIFTRDAAQRLARTTQQLLALAKSEHRAYSFTETRPVDLEDLAARCVSDHVARAGEAGIDLGAELTAARVDGVDWLLAEALGNLLDNAITYTPAGGAVTVRCGTGPEGVYLEVVDSGIGIPESERRHVLTRFYRGTGSRGIGSGLGLAIVADVAQRHGAVLTLSPGDADRGTRVRLEFPPARYAAA